MRKTRKVLIAIWGVVFSAAIILGSMPLKASAKELIPVIQFSGAPKTEYFAGDRVEFNINAANYGGKVEYRVVLWNDSTKSYSDLWNATNGYPGRYYTRWQPTGNTNFTLGWPINEPGSYRITVYAKRVGIKSEKAAMKGMNCDSFKNSVAFIVKSRSTTMNEEGKTYGSKEEGKLEVLAGDTKITAKNISLCNAKIEGNLEITGDNTIIKNVKVLGKITINVGKDGVSTLEKVDAKAIEVLSAGKNSIHIKGVKADNMDVNCSNPVRIEADGDTEILSTTANGYIILDRKNGTFGEVKIIKGLNGEPVVEFIGDIKDKVFVNTKATIKVVGNSSMETLVLNTDVANDLVKIEGNFNTVEINRPGKLDVKGNSKVSKLVARSFADINVATTSLVSMIEKGNNNVDVKIEGTIGNTSYSSMGGGGGNFTGGGTVTPPAISLPDLKVKKTTAFTRFYIAVEMEKMDGLTFMIDDRPLYYGNISYHDGIRYLLSFQMDVGRKYKVSVSKNGYNTYTAEVVWTGEVKEISRFYELKGIIVCNTENIRDLAALKATGRLPDKIIAFDDNNAKVEIPITDWTGTFNGAFLGYTNLKPVISLPKGYQDNFEPINVTVKVNVVEKQYIDRMLYFLKEEALKTKYQNLAIYDKDNENKQIEAVKALASTCKIAMEYFEHQSDVKTEIEVIKDGVAFNVNLTVCGITQGIVINPSFIEASPITCFKFDKVSGTISGVKAEIDKVDELTIPCVIDNVLVKSLAEGGLTECNTITKVTLPAGVIVIGKGIVNKCNSLETINILQNVMQLDVNMAIDCPNIIAYNIDPNNISFSSIDGAIFSKNLRDFIRCPQAREGVFTFPNGVANIKEYAFYDCSLLTEVILPEGISEINKEVFGYCTSLTSLNIPSSVCGIDVSAFDMCLGILNYSVDSNNSIYYSDNGCIILKRTKSLISVPKGKTSIDPFPKNVCEIGKLAFVQCINLTSIDIPWCINVIDEYAFGFCVNLQNVNIFDFITLKEGAFAYCANLETITIGKGVNFGLGSFIDPETGYNFEQKYNTYGPGKYIYNNTTKKWEKISASMSNYEQIKMIQLGSITEKNIQYKTAEEVITNLRKAVDVFLVDSKVVSVPISWIDTDKYNSSVAGSYTFTASWGELPLGIDNIRNITAPTVEVIVADSIVELSEIKIFPEYIALVEKGVSKNIEVCTIPGNATYKSYTWKSSNPDVVEVKDGVLTPHLKGIATITATSIINPTLTSSCKVNVVPESTYKELEREKAFVESLDFSEVAINGKDNEEEQIKAIESILSTRSYYNKYNAVWNKFTSKFEVNITLYNNLISAEICPTFIEATPLNCFSFNKDNGIIGILDNEREKIVNLVIPSVIDGVLVSDLDEKGLKNCVNMTSVFFPIGFHDVSVGDMQNCSQLKNIYISGQISYYSFISLGSLEGFKSLTNIIVDKCNIKYCSIDGVLFDKESNLCIYPPGKTQETYTVPDGTTGIKSDAFYGCQYLVSINLPREYTTYGYDTLFKKCSNLMNINVNINNTDFFSENGILYNKTNNALYRYPEGRGDECKIAEGITQIWHEAFMENSNLTSITFLNGIRIIRQKAFYNCKSIKKIVLPDSIEVGSAAFFECVNLNEITIGNNVICWDNAFINNDISQKFLDAYKNGGAGTYIYENGNWIKK